MIRPLAPPTLALVVAAGALTGCGNDASATAVEGPSVTVSHAQGETEVPLDPQRVITFDIGTLDTIDALGGDVTGVPQEFVPEFLEQYTSEDYVNAGTLFEPDFEAVNEAEPDLIIVGGRSAEAYEDLSDIAPTIDLTVDSTDFLNSFREQTETLGTIFEAEKEAERALADIEGRVEQVKQRASRIGTGLVVLTTGGEVSAYGSGSRFGNVIHDALGVEPADTDIDADTHGEAVSFEYIAETDPDWLFVVDRDVATGESEGGAAEQVLDNDLVARSTAWQKDQIVYLDPVRWYIVGSGLSSVEAMVAQLQESLR